MDLNSRQISILQILPSSVEGMRLSELIEEFQVSRRTVYYDINRINDWLGSHRLGHVRIEGHALRDDGVAWDMLRKYLGSEKERSFSIEERRSMEILRMALSGEITSINSLAETFEISRNTVIADVREMKERALGNGLVLESTPSKGYCIQGNEIAIRKLIWGELRKLTTAGRLYDVRRFLQHTLVSISNNDIDYYELCHSLIKQYESDLQTRCFLDSNGLEGMMIQVSWLRGLSGNPVSMSIDEQATLKSTSSYRSVECSAAKLKTNGLNIPSSELFYITSLLLGIKTMSFDDQSEEEAYVSTLAESLIYNFERVACLTYANKEFVRDQLAQHIRSLYYRQKYGIPIHNPLTEEIQKMYPLAFEFCRRAAIEAGMEPISDGELAYLTIYLSSDLDVKMLGDGDTSASKVLIVGAENRSTATLIQEQLSNECGINFEYSYADPERVHRWELESYALVIALRPMPRGMTCDNVVETPPILSEEGKRQVFGILKENRIISRYDTLIDEVIGAVRTNVPSADIGQLRSDKLHFELFRLFDDRGHDFIGPLSVHVGETHIRDDRAYLKDGSCWGDAVLLGARCLQGSADKGSLVERMRNIMAGDRFMFYHMSSDVVVVRCPMQGDQSARVEAQIVVSREPVLFPDGAPARIIVCISTINRYSHWGTLYGIYHLLSQQDNVDELLDCFPDALLTAGEGE